MKSVLPLAVGVLGVGAIIYYYVKQQRDKDKKKKPNDSDNNNGSPETKTTKGTSNKTALETLEFKVDNNFVPLIIGRNSVNLKTIEEKTKTHIKFRECDDENQMCSISGTEADVKSAKELIDVEMKKQPIITDEILLPTTSCGKIEGYGGTVLHEICQLSSAKVWVDSGVRKAQGEDRRVLITGTKEQVELAKKLIEERVKETPVEQNLQVDEKEKSKSLSPFPSNSSITTTESPREIMLPSPEKLKNNDGQLEVYVSAVESPSRFWVQLTGPQDELAFLVNAMTEYYYEKANQELHAIREPYLGQIVAAVNLTDERWYRAEIVAIQPSSNDLVLDVYFLDFGEQQFCGRKDILELRADFLSLRFQAIECFLAHVQPINTGSKFEEWDRKAIEKFESLVQYKKMISKVVTYKERKSFALQRPSNKRESSPIPGVELYEDDSECNIALELVQSGCAEMSDRFGDLAKSSVLTIVDDKESRSKEATPEPKDVVKESFGVDISSENDLDTSGKKLDDTKDSHRIEQVSGTEESDNNSKADWSTPADNNSFAALGGESDLDKIGAASSVAESIEEIPKSELEKVPLDNNNDSSFNPPSLINGKSHKEKRDELPPPTGFGGVKPPKSKKKKQQQTADFLQHEQQGNTAKKPKTEDWNTMVEEDF